MCKLHKQFVQINRLENIIWKGNVLILHEINFTESNKSAN